MSERGTYQRLQLARIAAKVERTGPHRARSHEDRAAQFVPFAALSGYGEALRERERQTFQEKARKA